MPYELLSESTPLNALIILIAFILISVLGFFLKKFGEILTYNRVANEKALEKAEKTNEKLMEHLDKTNESQNRITSTLEKMNDKIDKLDEKVQRIENNRR